MIREWCACCGDRLVERALCGIVFVECPRDRPGNTPNGYGDADRLAEQFWTAIAFERAATVNAVWKAMFGEKG